ncbi:MAG: glycosyltransferase [Pseudomonadota bacterium]
MINQGFALLQAGKLQEAEAQFRAVLQHQPTSTHALHGLAIVAHRVGQFQPALAIFDQALASDPQLAAVWVNRGNTLAALQRHAEAVASFQRALDLSATLPSALINMATALHVLGRLDEAVAALELAKEAPGASAELFNNLGNMVKDQGRLPYAQECYQQALHLHPMMQQAFSNTLSAAKVDPSIGPVQLLALHREWAGWFEAVASNAPLLANLPAPDRRLKIGYVSPDCHTAVPAFLDPVIAAHDRSQFEVFCYFNHPQTPEKLAALGVSAHSRLMRGRSDQEVAKQVHDDGIDILIDIAGHTGHNRLGVFAQRPAPVQMSWLDYLCTTGLAAMDYRISDYVADPKGSEVFHSEKLLRFPAGQTQWCWRPDAMSPDVAPLPASAAGTITFGSFNHAQKLSDATLALWHQLLQAMPGARLCIAGIPEGLARERILAGLACDAARVDFWPRMPLLEYRQSFAKVDIALDPMPFSGATTTLDALWQGVPVLTLPGSTSCSRSSASLLTALGLQDWIANSAQDFVDRAQKMASDLPKLASLRSNLRARLQASTPLDTGKFVDDLQDLYRQAWRDWCNADLAADGDPTLLPGTDQALQNARQAINAGDPAQALQTLSAILKIRPHWSLAKQETVRASLPWSRTHPEVKAAWAVPIPTAVEANSVQRISAIICSIKPAYFAKIRQQLIDQFPLHAVEVIGIHDATSLCEGYNRGAAQAKGEILIFCHDDIEIVHTDFGERLLHHLRGADLIGVAGTSKLVSGDWRHAGPPYLHGQIIHRPVNSDGLLYFATGLQQAVIHNIQAVDGVFIAVRRTVWEALRFDADRFDGFHLYDIDFSFRAHLAGYRLVIPMDLLLIHFSTGRYNSQWQSYNRRFLEKFPALSNRPSPLRDNGIQVKLQSMEQIDCVHAALLHHAFGASNINHEGSGDEKLS